MPKGKGTYGTKKGRPPKKMNKGGDVRVVKIRGGGAATQGLEFKVRD
tara:strand:+ start:2005 stop:2145 length:141 start_codon:yes stop_codon:yes gene_type:complete